jgi:hypothetical protein
MSSKPTERVPFWGGHVTVFVHDDGNASFISQYPCDAYVELMNRLATQGGYMGFDANSWSRKFQAHAAARVLSEVKAWAATTGSGADPCWSMMDS